MPERVTKKCVGRIKKKKKNRRAKKCKEKYEITPFGQAYVLTVITMIRWTDCPGMGGSAKCPGAWLVACNGPAFPENPRATDHESRAYLARPEMSCAKKRRLQVYDGMRVKEFNWVYVLEKGIFTPSTTIRTGHWTCIVISRC